MTPIRPSSPLAGNSHIVAGDGMILGLDPFAKIRIAAGIRFQSELADPAGGVRGGMTIQGLTSTRLSNGMFRNWGIVNARIGAIVLHADTLLKDIEGAIWTVTQCKTDLIFDRECLTLDGDFVKVASGGGTEGLGRMVFNASIQTCGELIYDSPGMIFENSSCFYYASFSGSLPNPGNAKPPVSCQSPWILCQDQTPASCT